MPGRHAGPGSASPGIESDSAFMSGMAQPHKGLRHQTTIRYPEPLHHVLEERRAGSGYKNLNDFAVALLEKAVAADLFPDPLPRDQDRLPLSA